MLVPMVCSLDIVGPPFVRYLRYPFQRDGPHLTRFRTGNYL